MNLYKLTELAREIMAALDEAGGELTPEIAAKLDALEGDVTSQTRTKVCMIRELQVECAGLREEIKRLQERHSVKTNAADGLKRRILDALVALNIGKLDVGIAAVSVRVAPRPAIAWAADALPIPADFARVRTELDGDKAYAEWKAKGELPAGFNVKHSTYLMIR